MGRFYFLLKVLHASARSEFIACAACEIPQQISFYLHVSETLLELSPLKAALPLLIASAVTELAPACCFAAPGALCLVAVMEVGRPRIRKNVESGRGWHRQRLNVISRQPALSFSASGVPAGLAMKNRATERRFRGRRRLPEGAEIQKLGGLKFDLLLSAFLLF